MAKEDLYAFGSVLSELGRGFIQVTGPSRKTTENLARASGRPILYNVVSPEGVDQHGQPKQNHMKLLKWLDEMNQEKGLRIFGQAITTMALDVGTHFSLDIWNLFDQSKPWRAMTIGSPEERMEKMRDPELRNAAIAEYEKRKGRTTKDLGLNLIKVVLSKGFKESVKQYEGMVLKDIAKKMDKHPVEAFIDLSIEDDLTNVWQTAVTPTNLGELVRVANSPYCLPGVSDGGAHTKFITAGDFSSDFLVNLVRDNDGMSLEEAHWRLSKYPAQAAGMFDRGSITVGMPADLLVYDLKNMKILPEEVAYDFPGGEWRRIKRCEGYSYTIVNGEITFEGMRCTGSCPGRLLRHGRAQDMI